MGSAPPPGYIGFTEARREIPVTPKGRGDIDHHKNIEFKTQIPKIAGRPNRAPFFFAASGALPDAHNRGLFEAAGALVAGAGSH